MRRTGSEVIGGLSRSLSRGLFSPHHFGEVPERGLGLKREDGRAAFARPSLWLFSFHHFAHPDGMGCSPDANTRAVTLAGGWLGAVLVVELIEQSIPQPLDLPPELGHVQRFILRRQSLSRRSRDLARLDQALVRRLRLILLALDFSTSTHLLGQLHRGLKEVLIDREAPI